MIMWIMWMLSVWISLWITSKVQAADVAVITNVSISVQEQKIVDMVSMRIDQLTLEETKLLWSRWLMLKEVIPSTHRQIRLVDRISTYIQDSVEEKSMMLYDKTIAELAMSNPDLSMLVDIVVYLDLADTLMADGSLTVFAPTNQAFANALETLWITADELMADKELLTNIIMHHVLTMKVTAQDAMNLNYGTLVETASGETIRVRANGSVMIDDATVIDADMMASNGVVHVIDTVLLPPSFQEMNGMMTDRGNMNIVEVAMWNDMFTTLVAGIQAADFAEMLMMDGPYTVFAPTNEAFTAFLEANHMTAAELLADKATLQALLSYHVLAWFYTSWDVTWLDMKTMFATANWASVEIDPAGKVNWATITNADIYASNGIVHVIDHVLMPPM